MAYTPRLIAPTKDNHFYYEDNPFEQSGYGIPNCTAYAFGRFFELLGTLPELSRGDAGEWFNHSDPYERGSKPRLGAVICWRSTVGGAGHVAIVEQINSDGSIIISQSAWGGTAFWTDTIPNTYYYSSSYDFQGFIYNPAIMTDVSKPKSWIKGNRYLNDSEMENNAILVYVELMKRGWSTNAIAGLLGNMESESTINPGIWQNISNPELGFGLVQWSPSTIYTNWAKSKGYAIDNGFYQLKWIDEETTRQGQWIATDQYPMTFEEFKTSSQPCEHLASAFLKNFERAGVEVEEERREQSRKWYTFISNLNIITTKTVKVKKGFNFILFNPQRKRGYIQ